MSCLICCCFISLVETQAAIFILREFRITADNGETTTENKEEEDFIPLTRRGEDTNNCPYKLIVSHHFPNFVDNYTREEKIVQRVKMKS